MSVPDFSGVGYLAGEAPDGLTTVVAVPVTATVQVLWRDPDTGEEHLVASTTSAPDGTWRITGLNHELEYVVRGIKDGWNDVTVVGVTPSRMDEIAYTDLLEPTEAFDGLAGHVHLDSGLPPFTSSVVDPLPFGLSPSIVGRKLIIEGTSDDDGVWDATIRVTADNEVYVDVPVRACIGLAAPVITTRYAVAGDWEITLDLAGVPSFAEGVRIYRSTSPMDPEDLPEPVAMLDPSDTEWTDTDIEPGETYYYRAASYHSDFNAVGAEAEREAVWTPADLAVVPKIWVDDESEISTVSGAISSLGNRGSLGGGFSQSAAENRPLLIGGELSGHSVLRFDGVNDRLPMSGAGGIFQNTAAGWLLAVCKKREIDPTGVERVLLYTNSASYPNRFSVGLGNSGLNANKPYLATRRVDSVSTAFIYATDPLPTQWVILRAMMNWQTGNAEISVNGVAETNPALTTPGLTSNTASADVAIAGTTGGYPDMDLATLLVGAGSLPDASETARLEGWAAHRYGLTANLPVDHPYKEVAP